MTADEQQQQTEIVSAGMRFAEQMVATVVREGANMSMQAKALAIELQMAQTKLANAEARIKELEPKHKGK